MNRASTHEFDIDQVTRPPDEQVELSSVEAQQQRETWLEWSRQLAPLSAPRDESALLARLETEFRTTRLERSSPQSQVWGRTIIAALSTAAAIALALYLGQPAPVAEEITWDDNLLATVVRINQEIAAIESPPSIAREFEGLETDLTWIDAQSDPDAF